MAAPVFRLDAATPASVGDILDLDGAEAHHAIAAMRLRAGERVDLVDGAGRRIEGTVAMVERDRLGVAVSSVRIEPEPQPRIVVIQALAKGDRGERAVETLTEVGVDVIVPWAASHCVVRWEGEKADRGVAKWRTAARAAAKQSRRARDPEVTGLHATADLAAWIGGAALAVVLDESADSDVAGIGVPPSGDIVLVVGPEGGLTDAERATLVEAGARLGRLGPTVLRTSTAGTVAAAVMLARTPRWNAPYGMPG
jgi:16S rRNA (uracil1498-N3)-methyltransferase